MSYEFSFEGGDLQKLLNRFEDMLKKNTRYFFDVIEFEGLIDYYLDMNKFQKAIKACDIALSQHPGSSSIRLKKAQIYIEKGDPLQGIKLIEQLEKLEQNNYEIYFLKGTAYCHLNKIREAIQTFDYALQLSVDSQEELLYEIATAFEYANQFKVALDYLLKAYELDNENLPAIYDIANCYERIHDYENSIVYYLKYIDLEPFSEHVWYNVGTLYYKKGKFDQAIEAYDFAIAINDRYASAFFNKANTLANWGKYEEAVEAYKDFIELDAENEEAWCYLGECYEKMGQYDKAIEHYGKSIDLDHEYADGWFGLGICRMFMGNYKEAELHIRKAIRLENDNPEYWFAMGNLMQSMDRYAESAKSYRKAIELDPYDYETWLNYSELEFNEKGPVKAILLLKEAYQYNADVAEISFRLAAFYLITGEERLALKFIEEGLNLDPQEYQEVLRFYPKAGKNPKINQLLKKYLS